MPLEDFIITVFCLIADIYGALPDTSQFRGRGFAATALSDEEVITVEIIEELTLANKGLIGSDFQQKLKVQEFINLQTPVRKNMPDARGKDAQSWLISILRLVETVIGQLTEQFNIQKVKARSLWHLTNQVTRKVLFHTVAVMINKSLVNPPLQFKKLVLIKS